MQTVTLNLPDVLMQRATQTADVLKQPLEEMLTSMLELALPNVADAPPDMQAELTQMTWLSDWELWAIARSQMTAEQQQELQRLSAIQQQRSLVQDEQETINQLRHEYGRITLLKARAYALLSIRSGRPLLHNL
ncbi:MAG: hypothetical protein R3C14_15950 [Caldilineaceae bacterium]